MSSLVLLDSAVSIAEAPDAVILDSLVSIIDPALVPIELDLTVLTDAIEAGVAPFRAVCSELWIDLGAGLEQIPGLDIGTDVAISESMDNVVDQLTFSLVGDRYDPLLRGALRGKQQVQLFVSYGEPGADYRAEVFNGFLLQPVFDGWPPVAHCTALDSGCVWSEQLVTVDIPAGSGRSRLSILMEQAAALDPPCPIGTVDLGSADGGIVNKAVSVADVRFADFARDFLSPCGVQVWFSGGRLNLTRIKAEAPFVVVGRENIALPLTVTTPATQTATVVLGVATRTDSGGLAYKTTVTEETTTAPYAPMENTGGVPGFGALTDRIISRIVTTTTSYGDTAVRIEVDEYAWYAPMMARLSLHTDDSVVPVVGTPPFLFPDGTYRRDAAETLMLIRKTVTTRTLGIVIGGAGTDPNVRFGHGTPLDLFILRETIDRYFWHFIQTATYVVSGGVDTNLAFNVYLTENGDGVAFQQEQMGLPVDQGGTNLAGPDSQTVTETAVTGTDGQIDFTRQTDLVYSTGVDQPKSVDGTFVYGTGTRVYKSLPSETRNAGKTVKTTRYTATGEDTYAIAETTTATGTLGPVRVDSSGTGARPFAAKVNPVSSTQELHSTITDTLRVTLSGLLTTTVHNEYAENADELRAVAMVAARDLAAIDVAVDMPLEGRVHKGRWIALDLEERGLSATVGLYVWSVARNVASYRETLGLKLYAPGMLP